MAFDLGAEKYDRFMGRFASPLAEEFIALVDPQPGQRAVDVGCGPGALTALLVSRLGRDAVVAIDPSAPFIDAVHERFPGLDARVGAAEELPYADDEFDFALAQLVVQFMSDPVAALREMRRVTRPGGLVAASVWDYEGGGSPLSPFWRAVHETDPEHPAESGRAGVGQGQLVALFERAGLSDVREHVLTVRLSFDDFEELWEPYTFGVGPPGDYINSLDEAGVAQLKRRFAAQFPPPPFIVSASAWVATGRA